MIDFLHIVIDIKHEEFGNTLINLNEKTSKELRYRKPTLSKSPATNLRVKSTHNGNKIEVSGNFVKYLQGHNIFGTNNLFGLCVDTIKAITKEFGIKVTQAEKDKILQGEFDIYRVDLAANFKVHAPEEVAKVIREFEFCGRELGKNVSNYTDETVYFDQHSNNVSLKLYNKSKEISVRPLPEEISGRDRLLDYTEKMVRAEIRLGHLELKRREINKGGNWSIGLAKQLLLDEITATGIKGEIKRLLLDDEYEYLSNCLKPTYRLWLLGDDVESIIGYQKFRRHRGKLMKYGIDIAHAHPKERVVMVDIGTILSSENMLSYPVFAKEYGLIHQPKLKRPIKEKVTSELNLLTK